MNRFVLIFMWLVLSIVSAFTQPVIDGDPSDWTGIAPSTDNTFVYSANTAGGLNEWIWKDAAGDNRTDNFNAFVDGTKQDLLEFRIASDANNLYILSKFPANIDKTPGDGSLQIQISLRRQGSASVEEYLGGVSSTRVPTSTSPGGSIPDARWDYLILSRAGSSNNNFIIWTSGFGSSSTAGNLQWNNASGIYEGSIPWSVLGGAPGNESIIFTISLYRSNPSDDTFDTGGDNSKGNCLDYVTVTSGNTYDALIPISNVGTNDEGRLDYAVQIDFSNDQSLPVTLSSFTATTYNNTVVLQWVTESEVNNEAFILERSTDNYQFLTIAEIPGQGNTTERHAYEYTDKQVTPGTTYYYRLSDRDYAGNLTILKTIQITTPDIFSRISENIPGQFMLYPNFPNPFNPSTTIRFDIAGPESRHVQLAVFTVTGQKVATLVNKMLDPGRYEVLWDGRSDVGEMLPSGIYWYQLKAGGIIKTRKMILMK